MIHIVSRLGRMRCGLWPVCITASYDSRYLADVCSDDGRGIWLSALVETAESRWFFDNLAGLIRENEVSTSSEKYLN